MNVALITGASRGIGANTARLLAEKGYAVCINYHTAAENAQRLATEINEKGGTAIAIQADMAQEEQIIRLFETVKKELGPVEALVNNAGINGGICAVADLTTAQLLNVFATNVFGTIIACREALSHMKLIGKGAIVNVSSEAAKFGGTKLAHYAASKAAINTFTIGFAREVADQQIRVNVVSPGVIDTDMHRTSPPERLTQLTNSLPMKRMGKPSEVAELIHWLLSDAASYISGAIIPVTGSR